MKSLREIYEQCDVSNNRVRAMTFPEFKESIQELFLELIGDNEFTVHDGKIERPLTSLGANMLRELLRKEVNKL